MKQQLLVLGLVGLTLGGCASPSQPLRFDRPNTSDAEFARDKARCYLTAKSVTGRPYDPTNMGLSQHLFSAARDINDTKENFQLCMMASGYTEAR